MGLCPIYREHVHTTIHVDIGLHIKVRLLHSIYLNLRFADSILEFRILRKAFSDCFRALEIAKILGETR
jgi:hypothetical protein